MSGRLCLMSGEWFMRVVGCVVLGVDVESLVFPLRNLPAAAPEQQQQLLQPTAMLPAATA